MTVSAAYGSFEAEILFIPRHLRLRHDESEVTPLAEVRRKKGESFESLLRRFSRRIQMSGKLIQAKKVRFYEPPKSKREVRASALHRMKMREKRDFLLRSGKLTEEDLRQERRRRF